MKKILILVLAATTLFSCSKTDSPTFDGSRRIVYFEQSSATLDVVLDVGGEVSIDLVTPTRAQQDIVVNIGLESATIDESAFTYPETVTIPAGEFRTSFTVEGFSIEDLTTSNELLTFFIDSTNVGADLNGSLQQAEVAMRLICPVPEDFFVGDYAMTQTSSTENPFFGSFGRALGDQDVTIVNTGATTRRFDFSYFPGPTGFNSSYFIEFDISCGTVNVNGTINEGNGTLGCGDGSIGQGTPTTPTVISTVDGDDVITIDVLDFAEDGGCGTTPYVATLQFTKL